MIAEALSGHWSARFDARNDLLFVVLASVLVGCGGGGSDSVSAPGVSPVPRPNSSPTLANPNPDVVHVVQLHGFSYDVTQGGTTFADADGDALTYSISLNGRTDGVSASNTHVQGVPVAHGLIDVVVYATDGLGTNARDEFTIAIRANRAPQVVNANAAVLTTIGGHVNYDAARGGATFADPDGDALTYEVEFLSDPRGLSIDGTYVVGALSAVGAVRLRIVAHDPYGLSGADPFMVAVPAAEPGAPSLPATSFVYDDAELPLPYRFRFSRENVVPFWDTTPQDNPTTNAGATLGRVLFYDKRLSITNTVACGSCHEQQHGFGTSRRFDVGVIDLPLKRNSMPLAQVRYDARNAFFWDSRTTSLETLALIPIAEPTEMGNSVSLAVSKVALTGFYPALFEAAFGTPEITDERIAKALAQFLRAMISYQSKFDEAFSVMDPTQPADPATVLTVEELRGNEIFRGAAGVQCSFCHIDEVQKLDEPANNGLDIVPMDPGSGGGGFKPPSLRNIAVTAPYMHDGRLASLRAVIDHYDHGIQRSDSLSRLLKHDDGTPTRMNLSEADKLALEAFLRTLTDERFLNDQKFSDPFL